MYDGKIYVAGKVKSLGIDCVPGEWDDTDTEFIQRKFEIYGLGEPPDDRALEELVPVAHRATRTVEEPDRHAGAGRQLAPVDGRGVLVRQQVPDHRPLDPGEEGAAEPWAQANRENGAFVLRPTRMRCCRRTPDACGK